MCLIFLTPNGYVMRNCNGYGVSIYIVSMLLLSVAPFVLLLCGGMFYDEEWGYWVVMSGVGLLGLNVLALLVYVFKKFCECSTRPTPQAPPVTRQMVVISEPPSYDTYLDHSYPA